MLWLEALLIRQEDKNTRSPGDETVATESPVYLVTGVV